MATDPIGRGRRVADVGRDPLKLGGILRGDSLSVEEGKPAMHPDGKILHETLRRTFLLMQTVEEKTAKQLQTAAVSSDGSSRNSPSAVHTPSEMMVRGRIASISEPSMLSNANLPHWRCLQ